ncbi:MAG TPA: sulfite exporter TauE/SafE family protein, partial [Candidatus Binataceae bacterium]|nr:sulfite exporter TauE/SafE family protein [Candidatus Binataceae bacterium]
MLHLLFGLFALALGAGFVGALSGLGGGVFIVPALVVLAKMPMKVAVGASLISVVATSAGASVAFVRDGWTNLKVAMVLECATVTGALTGAYLAGIVPTNILELLFALMMLQSAFFSMRKQQDDVVQQGDRFSQLLHLEGEVEDETGRPLHYEVINFPYGAGLMVIAGLMSGMLGIGAGALKVTAMDYFMRL